MLGGESRQNPGNYPRFLGYSWGVTLRLSEGGARGRTVKIRGHHGWGGGSRTAGGDITKYAKELAQWDADIGLYGHVHRKQTTEIPRMGWIKDKLIAKPQRLAICGTFLKTFSNSGDPTYAETHGFMPTSIGNVIVCIKPTHDWVEYWIDTGKSRVSEV